MGAAYLSAGGNDDKKEILGLLWQEVAGKPILSSLLQDIPLLLPWALFGLIFAKEGSGGLMFCTVLRVQQEQGKPRAAAHTDVQDCSRESVPVSAQVGADPASLDLPAAALLTGQRATRPGCCQLLGRDV